MTRKTGIIEELGEEALLLPELVEQALVANERAKYCFSLLQAARQRAEQPGKGWSALRAEREAAGVEDAALDEAVPGAACIGEGRYRVPHLDRILGGARQALDEMLRPFAAGVGPDAGAFDMRRAALAPTLRNRARGEIDRAGIGAITSGDRSAGDSPHLLVMDLHRALTALLEGLACEPLDGAQGYLLDDADREFVSAFMAGLNRTAPLRFGHPGLGTTAIRAGDRLLLQNDIGVTGAHVLVVSVAGTAVTVTCTDVHLPRLSFFRSLFVDWGVAWSATVSRPAPASADGGAYHLSVGRFEAPERERCAAFLTHLGSRIVFLIDWNKARKLLRAYLSDRDAVSVLRRAAEDGVGHRAFLELGGADLVDEALAALGPGRRLDRLLGGEGASDCLGRVLDIAARGLLRGEPVPLLEDRCRAELHRTVETARTGLLERCALHAALVVDVGLLLRDSATALRPGSGADRVLSNAALARRREREADRIAAELRALEDGPFSALIAAQDDALDALEEACSFAALLGDTSIPPALEEMIDLAVSAGSAHLRAVSATQRTLAGSGDVQAFPDVDRVAALGRDCEEARRRVERSLPGPDGGTRRWACAGLARAVAASTGALTEAARLLAESMRAGPRP
jgi:hypothetical protein